MKMFTLLAALIVISAGLHAQASLSPYTTRYAGSAPQLVKIADISGDGRNDIVVVNGQYFDPTTDNCLMAFLQDTNGAIGSPVITRYYSRGGWAGSGIDAFDFDHDGRSDIVIGYGDSVEIFRSLGNGAFQLALKQYSGEGVDGISIGDLDHDGYVDIAACHWNSTYLRVLWGDSTAFHFTGRNYGTPSGGYDQILISAVGRDTIPSLIYMRGQGIAAPIQLYRFDRLRNVSDSLVILSYGGSWPSANGIAVGDRQADGYRELACTWGGNQPNCGISFYDTLAAAPNIVTATYDIPEPVVSASLNCKAGDEYIIAHGGWNALSVVSDDTVVRFNLPYDSHYQPQGLDAGDINGDGYSDVVLAGYNSGLILLYNQAGMQPQITAVQPTVCSDTVQLCAPEGYGYAWSTHDTDACITVHQSGGYSLTMTNTSGCLMLSDTSIVTIHHPATIVLSLSHDSLVATGGQLYVWYRNGIEIYGQTSNIYVNDSMSAVYYVTSTDTAGCTSTSNTVQYIANGISTTDIGYGLYTYPNPAQGALNIEAGKLYGEAPAAIYNVYGQVVMTGTIHSGHNEWLLLSLPAGTYLFRAGGEAKPIVIE